MSTGTVISSRRADVVSMLAAGRPAPVDQLAKQMGVRRGELLTFLEEHPHLMETSLGWVNALHLADGVSFVHELSTAERDADVLAADDDLALWAVLAQGGLPLAGGGEVRALPLPELPSGVRSNLPAGCGLIGQGLVGPRGWLAGFQTGDVLLVQMQGGALVVRAAKPPRYRDQQAAALRAACVAALEQAMRRYREGGAESPTVDIAAVVTELLVTQPDVLAEPLPPLRSLLRSFGWETFGGQFGFVGTAWNLSPVRELSRSDVITAMRALGTMLTWDETHPDGEQAIEMLKTALVMPEIMRYLADEVERRAATAGTSFAAVLGRLAMAAGTPMERAGAALLAARAAEGAGDSDTAERLVKEALAEQADLQPALLDAAEYAACRGALREAEGYLRRTDHPVAETLRSAVRSVLDSPAGGGQPGRNHPCPCGSGRKYKLCCHDSAVPLSARSGLLYTLLAMFAQRTGSGEMLGILVNKCGGNLQAVILCVDLLLTHADAHERFLRARGHWLRDEERRLVEGWAKVPIGAFEVREVRRGIGVTVRMLPSGESIVLRDRKFSTCVHRLDLFCGRLLDDGTSPQLLALPAPVDRERRGDLLDLLACDPSAEQIAEFFGPQPDPYLVNSDGHDYVSAELTLLVPDAEAAWRRLAARLVSIDHDILEHHDERGGKVVSLGRITRLGRQWTLEANSLERLAALESLVRTEAPTAREVGRRAERLGGEPPSDDRRVRTLEVENQVISADTRTDDWDAEEHLLRTTRESWVDTPNSLGMTPREAAKAGGDVRRELEAILDDMQWHDDRIRDQGKPSVMDVAWIRRELGIPE